MRKMLLPIGEVRFNRNGSSGNIFSVMGGACKILLHCRMKELADEMISRVTNHAKSYDEALAIIGEYVRLVEDDNIF